MDWPIEESVLPVPASHAWRALAVKGKSLRSFCYVGVEPVRDRLLINIQNPERRGLNPLRAGRPEGGPSPLRAGTGYEPGRGGGEEGKPQATAPHPTVGTGLSSHRCGAAAAARSWCHPYRSLRGPQLQTPAVRNSAPRPERPRSPGPSVQAG